MLGRLWYPQLDVYDTIRRMGLLLLEWNTNGPSRERLFIADFYLANPPLLHKTQMDLKMREIFRSLKIPRQEKVFLEYPLAPILYHKMEPVQRKSLQTFVGKGMVDIEGIKSGRVELNDAGRELLEKKSVVGAAQDEMDTVKFLVKNFAAQDANGIREIRQRTGLRRAV